jgi:hypothetical protein
MRKELKRRPKRFEEVKGIGPKRAEQLREEFGSYNEFVSSGSSNALRNKLASTVSGNRRNLPNFAENVIASTGRRSQAANAVDSGLVEETNPRQQQSRSKTRIRERNKEGDRSDLGFEPQSRPDEDLEAAFDVFRDTYDDEFDVPAADLGRATRTDDGDDNATGQGLIAAATSRVTFARSAQLDDFRSELDDATDSIAEKRASKSPGELADDFTGFVEDRLGFEQQFGDFEIDRREYNRAEEFQEERSSKARRVDARRRAPVTDEITTWKSDPSHYDYPGIDTPSDEPGRQERDLPTLFDS